MVVHVRALLKVTFFLIAGVFTATARSSLSYAQVTTTSVTAEFIVPTSVKTSIQNRQVRGILRFSEPILGFQRKQFQVQNGRVADVVIREIKKKGGVQTVRFTLLPVFQQGVDSTKVSLSINGTGLKGAISGKSLTSPTPLIIDFSKKRIVGTPTVAPTVAPTRTTRATPIPTHPPVSTPLPTRTPLPPSPTRVPTVTALPTLAATPIPGGRIEVSESNPIVFVGSSTIAGWIDLEQKFTPLPVERVAGSGAKLRVFAKQAAEITRTRTPGLILVYAGTNDLAEKGNPAEILTSYQEFVAGAQSIDPNVAIGFISIFPSVTGQRTLPRIIETNNLIAEYSKRTPGLLFIDTYAQMIDAQGKAIPEFIGGDKKHMSEEGYTLWEEIFKDFFAQQVIQLAP